MGAKEYIVKNVPKIFIRRLSTRLKILIKDWGTIAITCDKVRELFGM